MDGVISRADLAVKEGVGKKIKYCFDKGLQRFATKRLRKDRVPFQISTPILGITMAMTKSLKTQGISPTEPVKTL